MAIRQCPSEDWCQQPGYVAVVEGTVGFGAVCDGLFVKRRCEVCPLLDGGATEMNEGMGLQVGNQQLHTS